MKQEKRLRRAKMKARKNRIERAQKGAAEAKAMRSIKNRMLAGKFAKLVHKAAAIEDQKATESKKETEDGQSNS